MNEYTDSMIRILKLMFINCRNSKKAHELLTTVYGTHVFLYGHVREQYNDRIKKFQKVTGIKTLTFNSLINQALEVINKKYREVLVRDSEECRRRVLIANIDIESNGYKFNFEIQLLIKSSRAVYSTKGPKQILPELQPLFDNNEIQLEDKVIAIETIVGILKKDAEENRDFKQQKAVRKIAQISLKEEEKNIVMKIDEACYCFEPYEVCKSSEAARRLKLAQKFRMSRCR